MTKVFVFTFILFCAVRAQICGIVTDSLKNKPLENVNVFIENTSTGIKTDSAGYYFIKNVNVKNPVIIFQHIAYKIKRKPFTLKAGALLVSDVQLVEKAYVTDNIMVMESRYRAMELKPIMHSISLTDSIILRTPGGFDDPLKAVQTYPGVNFIQDYSANLVIRGSGPSEQAIVLDGVLLQNPYRGRGAGFGGLTIINPEIIKNLSIEYGGFSARYGNRTGGLLNFETKDGGNEWKNNIAVNLIAARYFVEGHLADNLTFVFSARRSYYDWLIKKTEAQNIVFPKYYDVFGKLTWFIDRKNIIRFTQLVGGEGLKINENENLSGKLVTSSENTVSMASWKHFFSEDLQYQVTAVYQYNKDNFDSKDIEGGVYYNSKFKIATLNGLIRLDIAKYSTLIGGFSTAYKKMLFKEYWLPSFDYFQYDGFIENEFTLSESFKYRLGARYVYSDLYKKSRMSPRLSFQWQLKENISLSASSGTFYQFPEGVQTYNNPEKLEVYDYEAERPISAVYNALSVRYDYSPSASFTAEVYSKKTDDYPVYHSAFENFESNTTNYDLYSYGCDIFHSYSLERFSCLIGYSFSNTNIKEKNDNWIPAYFDQKHTFKFKTEYRFAEHWTINSALNSGSGFPFYNKTLWVLDYPRDWIEVESKGTKRMPYFRWDMRLTLSSGHFSVYCEVLNITDSRNADRNIDLSNLQDPFTENSGLVTFQSNTLYMIPRLPLIGINYSF